MSMKRAGSYDVLVVGGGVIGLNVALSLADAGRSVCLLDAGDVGAGAALGSCGTLTPSHAIPLTEPGMMKRALKSLFQPDAPLRIAPRWDARLLRWLLRFSRQSWPARFEETLLLRAQLLRRSVDALKSLCAQHDWADLLREQGHDYVALTEASWQRLQHEAEVLRPLGVFSETLSVDEIRQAHPELNARVRGALHFPNDAHVDPRAYLRRLVTQARSMGIDIKEHTAALGLLHEAGRVRAVRTPEGDVHGKDVVVCAGAKSVALLRSVGVDLPVVPGKGYSIRYPQTPTQPARPLVLDEPAVCVTYADDGVLIGSTMEFVGFDASLNQKRLRAIRRGAEAFFDALPEANSGEPWCGFRPMSADERPIMGPVDAVDGLWVATGHGMLGVTMSALTGQVMRAWVTKQDAGFDVQPYRPVRFA